jgi:dihydroorotate dehydrogenase
MTPCFFISAPFGNYLKPKGCISVTGTFTREPRGFGNQNKYPKSYILWKLLKTLRYDTQLGGWVNKLGLPNPGIQKGMAGIDYRPNDVLSIAEVKRGDFQKLNHIIPLDQSLEINLSCPNVNDRLPMDGAKVFGSPGVFAKVKSRKWCIAKLSPLSSPEEIEFVIEEMGFRQLHFSNTLPVNGGGLSGVTLKPFTLKLIDIVRERWGERIEIIAGGGVTDFGGVSDYLSAGANHVSLGSVCFNPFKLRKLLRSLELNV